MVAAVIIGLAVAATATAATPLHPAAAAVTRGAPIALRLRPVGVTVAAPSAGAVAAGCAVPT